MLGRLSLQFLIFLLEKEVGVGEQRGLVFLQSFEPESKWFGSELVEETCVGEEIKMNLQKGIGK